MIRKRLRISLVFIFGNLFLIAQTPDLYKGITITAPEKPFQGDPLVEVGNLGADAIAVIPYAYILPGEHRVRHNESNWQWWGERPKGVRKTIELAHKNGLRVLLKPQIYIPRSWIGSYQPKTDVEWEEFLNSYEKYILLYADIAQEFGVDAFCIATEFKAILKKKPDALNTLIAKVRTRFDGKLTYASNWDNYKSIPIWEQLDFVGINAYFPLSKDVCPSIQTLKVMWAPYKMEMAEFYRKIQKPICFTEYGYLSVDRCAWETWTLESQIKTININESCQSEALHAIWETFSTENWWEGGFLWKWFPEGMGHEGYVPKDYTPQEKEAQNTLRSIFREAE